LLPLLGCGQPKTNGMKQTLGQIHALQDLDREIERLARQADALGLAARNQERIVDEKRRRAQQAHEQRIQAIRRADATDLKIKEAEAEVARLKGQLNLTRNQKEYDAIQHGILSRQADLRKWEDEGLAALQSVDDLTQEEARLGEEVRQAEQVLAELNAQASEQRGGLDQRAAELQQERDRIRQQVNPEVLSAYERLTGHRGSSALAEVRDRICQGCFTRITKQTENLLLRGEAIVYCHSCGRMLMLVE